MSGESPRNLKGFSQLPQYMTTMKNDTLVGCGCDNKMMITQKYLIFQLTKQPGGHSDMV